MAATKTIYRQIKSLFGMSRRFDAKKIDLKGEPHLISNPVTYNTYFQACMRFAEDMTKKRGNDRFQICSITSGEIKNFLERVMIIDRPETVHQYASALHKMEAMTKEFFGRVDWKIEELKLPRRSREDVTTQRGPAYTPEEADVIISEIRKTDERAADALAFIRATGCRAETVFGRQFKGNKTGRDFRKAVTAVRINLKTGTVTLIEKGNKQRTVKYNPENQSLMEKLVKQHPYGNVFAGLRQKKIYDEIKKISQKHGITSRGLHGLRKTFAVYKHTLYTAQVKELIKEKDWRSLAKQFYMSEQKAKKICREGYDKSIDNTARAKLTRDLGHNRIEVTFRYVPK